MEDYLKKYQAIYEGTQKLIGVRGSGIVEWEKYGDGNEFLKKVTPFVQIMISKKQRAISILDYGCGEAIHIYKRDYKKVKERLDGITLYEHLKGMIQCYYCYDPAVAKFSVKPSVGTQFDFVALPDVLEHVPEEYIDGIISECFSYQKDDGLLMATISNNEAFLHFENPDGTVGENLHCTCRPMDFWIDKFKKLSNGKAFVIGLTDRAYMQSINQRATVYYTKQDSDGYVVDTTIFPLNVFLWYTKQ